MNDNKSIEKALQDLRNEIYTAEEIDTKFLAEKLRELIELFIASEQLKR